jgi:rfaE bifunctional protein kinase chain/domain
LKIQDFFKKVQKLNVLVVGDVMIDAYLWGDVNRISPEAPVPIVSVTKRENRLGGAANVALNLKSLGVNPVICSIIGQDEPGDTYLNLMVDADLSTEGMVRTSHRKTTKKTRVISGRQQLLRVDDEVSYQISPLLEAELINRILNMCSEMKISAIIFEDYDKGVINENIITQVTKKANAKGIVTSVDPKKNNYTFYQNVTLFKPNFKEFVEGSKLDILKADTDAIFKYAKSLMQQQNIQYIMVTLSELGVFLTDGKTYVQIEAEYRQIADVSGAGDTVISVATLLLLSGFDMNTIAEVSNKAGGLVCEKVGVSPISKKDLLVELQK